MGKRQDPFYQVQAILSRRAHSVNEVRQKLRRKGFTAEQIEKAVNWAQEKRFLSDEQFARAYAESIVRAKAVGPRWLRAKLAEKGIEADVIATTLEQVIPTAVEEQLAKQAIATWRRRHASPQHSTQRLVRFLLSRGFSIETIHSAGVS